MIGYFDFYKNGNKIESSTNITVDQYSEFIFDKIFKTNFESGYSDTRILNNFIVGISDEEEKSDFEYNDFLSRAIKAYVSGSDYVPTPSPEDLEIFSFNFDQGGSVFTNEGTYSDGYINGTVNHVTGTHINYGEEPISGAEFINSYGYAYTGYVNIPNDSDKLNISSKSIEFFMKTTATNPGTVWGVKNNDPNYEFIRFESNSTIRFDYYGAVTQFTNFSGLFNGDVTDGEWHYYSIVKDGSSCDLYIDSNKIETETGLSTNSISVSGFDAQIGAGDYWTSYGFNGVIDNFTYTSGCITETDIYNKWYNYVSGVPTPPEILGTYESEYIYPIKPLELNTCYIPQKRLLKIEGTSYSGQHVGTWRELGLVITGTEDETPLLFNRTTGFEITKTESDQITFHYNILF